MNGIDSWSDEMLLHAYARGRDDAFDELVRRHGPGIKAYAHRLLRNEEQAEDVYVETFARVVRNRDRLQRKGTARGFLYTIAHRLCIGVVRKRRTERDALPHLQAMGSARGNGPDSEAMASASELATALEAAVEQLSPEHREVLLLRTVHGLSGQETADVVGRDEIQVRSQLSWARKRIRELLARSYDAPAMRRVKGQGR